MKTGFIALLMLISSSTLMGQDSTFKQWLVLGYGTLGPNDISLTFQYNFGRDHFYQIASFNDGNILFSSKEKPDISSTNISYGWRFFRRYYQAAVFVGPAYVRISEKNASREKSRYEFGLVINAQFFLKPLIDIGIGLDGYINLNYINPIASLHVSVLITNRK